MFACVRACVRAFVMASESVCVCLSVRVCAWECVCIRVGVFVFPPMYVRFCMCMRACVSLPFVSVCA